MAKYRCKHCRKIMDRDSDKQWIKSYCETTGKNARLQRVPLLKWWKRPSKPAPKRPRSLSERQSSLSKMT